MASAQNDFLNNRCELIWQVLDTTFVLKVAHAAHTQPRTQKPKRTLNFQIMDPHNTDKRMLGPGTSGIRFAKKITSPSPPPRPGTEKPSGKHHSLRSLADGLASWNSSAQDRRKGAFQIVTRYEAVVQTITKFNHLGQSGFGFSSHLLFSFFHTILSFFQVLPVCLCRRRESLLRSHLTTLGEWATGWTNERSWFIFWQQQEIFVFFKAARPGLKSTQPPVQWVLRILTLGGKRTGM
jgi:hypothetical protein